MDNAQSQLIESIQGANNVLVTVSSSPSVDQLSAAIGLTLILNKLGKHATAVYSGGTPSTIEFLQPEKTLEKNTDSLRDFIIALDKSKADKLRYKVEEDQVRIFITPYRTSLTDQDLEFSQGDFNVDLVVALGVMDQKDLDQAITSHGRILHDATTISVTTGNHSSLGNINWADANASSLCEMVASIADDLQPNILDGQTATALMTGIVAETQRFSNEKTMPNTMSISAVLMAAGANQQLVASELEESNAPVAVEGEAPAEPQDNDGSLQIEHTDNQDEQQFSEELPELQENRPTDQQADTAAEPEDADDQSPDNQSVVEGGSSLVLEPPTLGGRLTASAEPEQLDPAVDPLSGGDHHEPLLSHQSPVTERKQLDPLPDLNGTDELPGPDMQLPSEVVDMPAAEPEAPVLPEASPLPELAVPETADVQTLSDLEDAVDSPHLQQSAEPSSSLPGSDELAKITEQLADTNQVAPSPDVGNARDAVSAAIAGGNAPLPPLQAIASQPLDLDVQQTQSPGVLDHIDEETGIPQFRPAEPPMPAAPPMPVVPPAPEQTAVNDPTAPPPVPPPMMPFDVNSTLPPVSGQGQQPAQGDPQNPFGLPPA